MKTACFHSTTNQYCRKHSLYKEKKIWRDLVSKIITPGFELSVLNLSV